MYIGKNSSCSVQLKFLLPRKISRIVGSIDWLGSFAMLVSHGAICNDIWALKSFEDDLLPANGRVIRCHFDTSNYSIKSLITAIIFLWLNICYSYIWNRVTSSIIVDLSWSVSYNTIKHYSDVIMGAMASQITRLTIVYSTIYSGTDQRKHQSSASLAFVWEIHRWPVNSPHKRPVTRKMFPFDDIIMNVSL